MPLGEKWMKFALLEGLTKAAARLLQKFVGIGNTAGSALILTGITGMAQMLFGLIFGILPAHRAATRSQILGSILFGFIATAMTAISVWSFTFPGADVGVTTFIVTLSIIPGAFIDWGFFNHPLSKRQWLGVAAFLASGYAILNFPGIEKAFNLPTWVLLTFLVALLAAINEAITQNLAKTGVQVLNPMVNNFWVGATTAACSAGLLISFDATLEFDSRLLVSSVLYGVLVVGMIAFKLVSYQKGGSIAIKKLVMQGTYLIAGVFFGIILYDEPLTSGKILGVIGYFVAFTLMDEKTWNFFKKRI